MPCGRLYDFAGMYADQLAQPGIYQISNSLDQAVADPLKSEKAINSIYGAAQFSYLERIFLDVTGRNDWSSTLPYGNNSFFYPSVSTSFLLNDMFQITCCHFFCQTSAYPGHRWVMIQDLTKRINIMIGSIATALPILHVLFNPDLKPEITSSYEAGLDLRMLKNRIGLDVAVYNNNSRNQILAIPLDPVSGYSSALVNAGLINSKGIEVVLYRQTYGQEKF